MNMDERDPPRTNNTNNSLKGWHCGLIINLPAHPNLAKLTAKLQKGNSINYPSNRNTHGVKRTDEQEEMPADQQEAENARWKAGRWSVGTHFLDAVTKMIAVRLWLIRELSLFALYKFFNLVLNLISCTVTLFIT